MANKKTFTQGKSKAVKSAKSAFTKAETKTKNKDKEVESNLKKFKVIVKLQQYKSDEQLKDLHQDMVVKKSASVKTPVKNPAPAKKKAEKKNTPPVTRSASQKLTKMQVN